MFQQLWRAKAEARKYHGDHLTLRQWQNIFKHNVGSYGVVKMNTKQMAMSDGAEYAMGRGSGLGTDMFGQAVGRKRRDTVPYATMMWAPLERRLDMALFRALFASSALQARQFILHGKVKVNGRVCNHPNYMLNPGDMFAVDPEMVLVATGQPKGEDVEGANFAQSESARKVKTEQAKDAMEELTASVEKVSLEGEAGGEAKKEAPKRTPKHELKGGNPYASDPNNAIDASKPYATPWRPKDLMAPFAFIPRYLEVNHSICHAVYLRHPICKPGESEIPSPFPLATHKAAYTWFLKRG